MLANGGFTIRVDRMVTRSEIAEIAKLSRFLGCTVVLDDTDGRGTCADLFHRPEKSNRSLIQLAAGLVALAATVEDRAPAKLIEQIGSTLEDWHWGDLDLAPSDQRPIGSGPDHPGHEGD